MLFDILTIFPEFFRGPLDYGIVRRARESGLAQVQIHDLRSCTHDRHRTVDDRPFGGGEGMVLKPEPIFELLESLPVASRAERIAGQAPEAVVLLSAQGTLFTQATAAQFSRMQRVVLICGRYEGVDERVSEYVADRELSVGNYVLSGGELAAAIVLEAVTRLIPGALGNDASAWQESFSPEGKMPVGDNTPDSTCGTGGLLDYPHYTRPADYRGMAVPAVLLAGNHEEIRRWRHRKALEKTLRNRPDLLRDAQLGSEDKEAISRRD